MPKVDQYLNEIKGTYTRTAKEIIEMLKWDRYSKGLAWQRKQILKQVFEKLDALGVDTTAMAKEAATAALIEGAEDARAAAGFKQKFTEATFLGIDKAAVDYAVKAITGDTLLAIENAKNHLNKVMRSQYLNSARNQKINRVITDSLVGGKSVAEAAKGLKGLIPAEWFDEYKKIEDGYLIKVGGRRMRLDDYAHLTAHTRLAGASNAGSVNWCLSHGFEFIQISKHQGACEICVPFELKIYSLGEGKKDSKGIYHPSASVLPNGRPPFHPYCRHRALPYGLAELQTAREYGTAETVQQVKQKQKSFAGVLDVAQTATNAKQFYGLSESSSYVRTQLGTKTVKDKVVPVFGWEQNGLPITDQVIVDKLNGMKLPPAWSKVHVTANPKSKIQAVGLDNAGRVQRRYSAEHVAKQAQEKFARVRGFSEDMPGIRRKVRRGMADGKPEAWLLDLEDKTVIRVGTSADLKAKKKAYGLTTLHNDHVTINGDNIRLKFTAKEGIQFDRTIKDKQLAKWLNERKKLVGETESLFPDVSAEKLNGYLHELSGGKYTVKDYRTYHGTRIAYDELKKYDGVSLTSAKEKSIIVKGVLDKVSGFLGNTPIMAKKSYIDSIVWELIGGI